MKLKSILLFLIVTCIYIQPTTAQDLVQTLRGTIYDKDSGSPLIGASLVIVGSDPLIGTVTDLDGEFRFEKLPLGRYNIKAYYVGYENRIIPNVLLGAGKEVVLTIELSESVTQLDEVVIKAKGHKSETINKMALVSARSFTVDETKKYAGSVNDPARMAASYAGVTSDPSGDNEIVIRGNTPRGLLWRLEGIEIPNPNHFAEEGSTGGPISILNATTLDNSDFFTGAFPAEYGNAYSGVFDINLRKGNDQKREYTFQAGVLGLDCSAEGPVIKNKPASFLINYRYSTLALLNAVGIRIAGDAVPEFQDLTFKLEVPTQKTGVFTVFGLGGISKIKEEDLDYQNDFQTNMGVVGITNTYFLNEKTYIKSAVAVTGSKNIWTYKEPDEENVFEIQAREDFIYRSFKSQVTINNKINSKHTLRSGVIFSILDYDLFTDSFSQEEDRLVTEVEDNGKTHLTQLFSNWKYRITEDVTLNSGLHFMYFHLNNNYSIEPRLGLRWQFLPRQAISAGFGIHSRIETLTNYLAQTVDEDGTLYTPNKNLDLTKSRHYVLGYENLITEHLIVKAEFYFQDLYDIPVEMDSATSFSALNYSWGYTTKKLANRGTGHNYGVELAIEKYFANTYYFMVTGSLYNSKYEGSDGIERDTRYNGHYVMNILGGKEFRLGNIEKGRSLNISIRASWAGGRRYSPIDLEESRKKGYTIRDDELAFTEQFDPYIRYDFKISYRKERPRTTQIIELDIQNVTNRQNVAGNYYSSSQDQVETWTQSGLIPVLSYRIEF